jgi:hypothetical protein
MLIVNECNNTTGSTRPTPAERRDDWSWDETEFAGDLCATHWIPQGAHTTREWPAIPTAPAVRIVYGEQLRGGY